MKNKQKIKENIKNSLQKTDISDETLRALLKEIKLNRLYEDKEIISLLETLNCHGEAINEFKRDAEIFTALDQAFNHRIDVIKSKFDSSLEELYHTMLAYEQQLRQVWNLPAYDQFNTLLEINFGDEENYHNSFDASTSVDHFISYFSITLRSFLKSQKKDTSLKYDPKKFDAACAHLPLSCEWSIFHEQRSIWEHGQSIGFHTESDSIFNASQSSTLSAFRISLSRLRSFRHVQLLNNINHPNISADNQVLPIHGFRSDDEARSAYMTCNQFYSPELQEKIHGARLCEWLRAYTIIKEVAIGHIQSHSKITDPSELLLYKDYDFFLSSFIDGGVPREAAKKIIEQFTFGSQSKDILDAPLIPLNDNLILLPAAAALIEPAFSIESLLKGIKSEKNHEVQIIGPGFESISRKTLADAGIQSKKILYKGFDCDIAFVLEESVLFLCECKGRFQVSDFRSHVDLENYLTKDVVIQHSRTCDYFTNNLQHIRNRLGLSHTWKPSRIIKVIITSAKLGRARLHDDFYIIDENMFYGFFSRTKASIRSLNSSKRIYIPDPRLEGAITVDSFINYMENPPTIARTRSLQKERESQLIADNRKITFKDIECYGEISVEKN